MTLKTAMLGASLLSSATLVGAVAPVMAQETAAQGASASAERTTAAEIIVTARKRDETLVEIPVSVTAFAQKDLDRLGINSLDDLSSFAPGLDFNNNDRVTPLIRFRGLEAVVNTPASRTGAVFWDGAYMSDGVSILPLFDLGRVEVIKGPQTAFFGRNTFSGAVNFIPVEPGESWSGRALVSYAPTDGDSHNVTLAVGGPLTDTIGIRIAGMTERVGADWAYGNGDPYGQIDTDAIMGTLVFKPSESLKIKVNGFYVDSQDTISQQSQAATTPAGQCNGTFSGNLRNVVTGANLGAFSTDLSQSTRAFHCRDFPDWDDQPPLFTAAGKFGADFPAFGAVTTALATTLPVELENRGGLEAPDGLGGKYSVWRANVSADYTLPNDATITATVSRGDSNNYNIADAFFGERRDLGAALFGFIRWTRDSYAEVRYTSADTGKLRYMLGFSYYKQDIEASNLAARKVLNFESGENYGIFGSIDYDFTDQLTLSLEGRWNRDSQTIVFNGPTEILPTETPAAQNVEQAFSKFMPRVILSYQPSPDLNLYASWSKSNIQGVATNANNYAVAVPGSGLDATTVGFFTPVQTLTAYEVGIKHQANDWLYYSLAAYWFDWDDQVFADLSPGFVPLNLPGDSRIRGLDFEANITPTPWLRVTANANYNDIELQNFGAAGSLANAVLAPGLITGGVQIDSAGKRPRWNPEITGSISTEFDMGQLLSYEPGAFFRVDALYTGSFFVDNFEFNSVPGYWRFNARVGANISKQVGLEVYGNNLTNNLSWDTLGGDTSAAGGNRKSFGVLPRKREVGVRLTANF
ncbi:MAG: TonB-dependent receptor [Polymorphobacter sp.]|uniref:TonB-dependent receptor n=1 Tax=Polymorphobacter sp. TaxID=1909290 RepID=UPI003A8A129D